jgi:hypothetical protein
MSTAVDPSDNASTLPLEQKEGAIMAEGTSLPYVNAYGNITKVLEKIRTAAVPDRFTIDFLSTTLGLTGGGARPLIPFLKRTNFLASDGTPSELYKRFRNQSHGGAAAGEALRAGYAPLYRVNEHVHDATDPVLKGIIVQVTGAEPSSGSVSATLKSFRALQAFATFGRAPDVTEERQESNEEGVDAQAGIGGIRLGYTINLNLPATSDIAVFNAIFKSLREHLLA